LFSQIRQPKKPRSAHSGQRRVIGFCYGQRKASTYEGQIENILEVLFTHVFN